MTAASPEPQEEEKKERGGCLAGADGCSALLDGGCCLLNAVTVLVPVAVPLILLR